MVCFSWAGLGVRYAPDIRLDTEYGKLDIQPFVQLGVYKKKFMEKSIEVNIEVNLKK